jgi:hypothetical protein
LDLGWYGAFRPAGGSLISAGLDGTERRALIPGGGEPGLALRSLLQDASRDRLYLFGATPSAQRGADPSDLSAQAPFVAAIRPGGAAPVGRRMPLPPNLWVEPRRVQDGYLYFVYAVPRTDVIAAVADLLSAHTPQSSPPSVWRLRVPE